MKEKIRNKKNKVLFETLANCGVLREKYIVEALKIPKGKLKSYAEEGLLRTKLIVKVGGKDNTKLESAYFLTSKGRNQLKELFKESTYPDCFNKPYVVYNHSIDFLLGELYTSLEDVERESWINREMLLEILEKDKEEFQKKFPEEFEKFGGWHWLKVCNAMYINTEGKVVYVSVRQTDNRENQKEHNYIWMKRKISETEQPIRLQTLDYKYRKIIIN